MQTGFLTNNMKIRPDTRNNFQPDSANNFQQPVLVESNKETEFPDYENKFSLSNEYMFSATEIEPEIANSMQFFVEHILYLFDYTIPSVNNTDVYSLTFDEFKIDVLKKTRLQLALSASGLSVAMIIALLTLPHPYNLASLALCGPLFVSSYGLITQK